MIKKSLFSFYGTHLHQSTVVDDILWNCARRNGRIAIGIDLLYLPPQGDRRRGWIKSFVLANYRLALYFRWVFRQALQGRIIIPSGLICDFACLIYRLFFRSDQISIPHSQSNLDIIGQNRFHDEQVATYIRYVSTIDEEFDFKNSNMKNLKIFDFRRQVYQLILACIFKLPINSYFSIYSSYLHSYLPCKTAANKGLPIVIFGCSDSLLRCTQNDVPRQFLWPVNTCPLLKSQLNKTGYLYSIGLNILTDRIQGNLDKLVSYMTASPYLNKALRISEIGLQDGNFKVISHGDRDTPFVVVYMHEFYDFHHNGVLPSFANSYYEWLLITLQILHVNRVEYRLKIHPAIVSAPVRYRQSLDALSILSKKFSEPIVVSFNDTTQDLVQDGMSLGCTVRGTVALELIFQGIPVVCSGLPPFANFIPSRCIDTLDSYTDILLNHANAIPVTNDEKVSVCQYTGFSLASLERVDDSSLSQIRKNKIRLPSSRLLSTLRSHF